MCVFEFVCFGIMLVSMTKNSYKGMGNLIRRGRDGKDHPSGWSDGTFYVIVQENGKRRRHRLEATTLKEARAEQARIFGHGSCPEGRKAFILGDCWNVFVHSPRRRQCGLPTVRHYNAFWRRFCDDSGGDTVKLSSVSPGMVVSHLRNLESRGLSSSTVSKVFKFLEYMFRVLCDEGKMEMNPCKKIPPPRFVQNRRRELTRDELAKVLDMDESWLKTLFYVGAYTGMRLGDCATLKWSEVDFANGVIRRKPNKTSKTSGAEISVGMSPTLREYLSGLERKGEYVNPHASKKYDTTSGVSEISHCIQAHFEKCGIQTGHKEKGKRSVTNVGFHSLRHTWITHQLEQGTPTTVVQMAVGHSSAQMTARYAHATPEMLRVMAERGEYSHGLRAKVYRALESCGEDIIEKVARLLGVVD